MGGFFKEDWKLLKEGGRNMLLFEILYKMIAIALAYPLTIILMNFAIRIAGVRYLTNWYIIKVITNPLVILVLVSVFLVVGAYILYEMIFISACYELRKKGRSVTLFENCVTSAKIFSKILNRKNWIMAPFTLISVLAINVTAISNMIINGTIKNIIFSYMAKQSWHIWVIAIVAIILVYIPVIMGTFVMNIFILEGKTFKESYIKSFTILKKHFFKVMGLLILYNVAIVIVVLLVYLIISAILILGVRLLDMAYMGSAVYLSTMRSIRNGVKIFLMVIAVPASYTMISRTYYRLDTDKNDLEPVRLVEKKPRRTRLICIGAFVLAMILNISYVVMAFNTNPFDKVAILSDIKITAHRGNSQKAPENTMAAFKSAMDDMADCIELDVQETSDGEIIVMHDSNVYRTTGVNRYVWQMSLSEIQELDAGSYFSKEYAGEKVPTLEEVIKLVKGKAKLNIEMKPSNHDIEFAQKVVKIVEDNNFVHDCVITSADYVTLKGVKSINDDIEVGYILSVAYGNFCNMNDIDFFSVNSSFLSKITVDAIHNSGKAVYAWTVNNATSIKNLANKGVDNIITDVPVTAREVIYSRNTSETLVNMLNYVFSK